MINGEKFSFGGVKIDKAFFAPVNDEVVLYISCHFDLTIEAGVNGSDVSVESNLKADAIGKFVNKD